MPLYDYTCEKCKKQFEVTKRINDSSAVTCPVCGSECKKNVSSTSFQLKGSGWYKTDYEKKQGDKKDSAHSSSCGCCKSKGKKGCGE